MMRDEVIIPILAAVTGLPKEKVIETYKIIKDDFAEPDFSHKYTNTTAMFLFGLSHETTRSGNAWQKG